MSRDPDRPLADAAARLRHHDRLLETLASGMGASDWRHRPEQGGNSAAWILGHLATYRRVTLRSTGGSVEEARWERDFASGAPCRDASVYPPPPELLADFARTGALLRERLGALGPADAAGPWPLETPDGSATLEGGVRSLLFHEAYHMGQLGYVRRLRGKAGPGSPPR